MVLACAKGQWLVPCITPSSQFEVSFYFVFSISESGPLVMLAFLEIQWEGIYQRVPM